MTDNQKKLKLETDKKKSSKEKWKLLDRNKYFWQIKKEKQKKKEINKPKKSNNNNKKPYKGKDRCSSIKKNRKNSIRKELNNIKDKSK